MSFFQDNSSFVPDIHVRMEYKSRNSRNNITIFNINLMHCLVERGYSRLNIEMLSTVFLKYKYI
jgi:hypothetical protein